MSRTSSMLRPRMRRPFGNNAGGFTYVVVLVLITTMGILAGVAQEMTWRAVRAERETELIFRGEAYVRAIESFRVANGRYPRDLKDLVRDPNSPTRRHLRALYPDPMSTGKSGGWQIVRAIDGGVQGVASSSELEPLKKANFSKRWKSFEQAKTYRDWAFQYVPRAITTTTPLSPVTSPISAPPANSP